MYDACGVDEHPAADLMDLLAKGHHGAIRDTGCHAQSQGECLPGRTVSGMPVMITMGDGVYQDAVAAAAEHGMSVSAWVSRCTRLETMRDGLTRHQQWCVAEGLTGPAYELQRAHLAVAAVAELDRLGEACGSDASDGA
jgi:hypothetical protein